MQSIVDLGKVKFAGIDLGNNAVWIHAVVQHTGCRKARRINGLYGAFFRAQTTLYAVFGGLRYKASAAILFVGTVSGKGKFVVPMSISTMVTISMGRL